MTTESNNMKVADISFLSNMQSYFVLHTLAYIDLVTQILQCDDEQFVVL